MRFPFQRPQPNDQPQETSGGNGGRNPRQNPFRRPSAPSQPPGPKPGPYGPEGGGNLVQYPEWFEPGSPSESAYPTDQQVPDTPIDHQVSQWPGWDTPSWQNQYPMGALPAGGDPATGDGGRGSEVRERNDYAAQQAMFAGGGPMFAGPDANPGGADLGGDGMPPAGFRIYGTM